MTRIMIAFACAAILVGCNTVDGIGEDVQQGGQAVEDAANNAAN